MSFEQPSVALVGDYNSMLADPSTAAANNSEPQIRAEVSGAFNLEAPRFVARAPGRLNVLGGLAEYSGGWVLQWPLAEHVCVCVQRRSDHQIVSLRVRTGGADGYVPYKLDLAELYRARDSAPTSPERRKVTESTACPITRCVVGTLAELGAAGLLSDLAEGLTVLVDSSLDELTDAGRDSALAAAVTGAAAAAFNLQVEWQRAAVVCQRVENHWLHRPIGAADAVCSLVGEPGEFLLYQADSNSLGVRPKLPPEVTLVGVDCSAAQADADEKYARVRTASFMGRLLAERILKHQGSANQRWNGFLAHIPVADYVEGMRDRIPTSLSGSEFLTRFGETGDALTVIDPTLKYKIRSRMEHHIYEQVRTREFLDALSRAVRKGDASAMTDAGEAMYASHWSYGQRCGLGSVETDGLVSLIRKAGAASGLLGAKIVGRGCCGMFVVLLRAEDRARASLEAILRDYQDRTGVSPRILEGSSSGVLRAGVSRN